MLELHIAYASPYTNIGVDVAYNMITGDSYPNLTILDVRTQSEHDDGHIYGAVWIPYTELQARIGELTGHENHEIIVYCKSGGRSAIASETLDSNNFTKVYNMLGGISAWQYSGYPVWIATVHNVNTTFNYDTIQAAIKAPQTLDGHTILVDEGTYYENVIVNKTISLIGENRSTTIIDGNGAGTVVTISQDNINITGFAIQNSGFPNAGVQLNNANQCNIFENSIINNWFNLDLYSSLNNSINGNNIRYGYYGIKLHDSSNNNSISGNNMTKTEWGIHLANSINNTIYGNNIAKTNFGIELQYSSNNGISGNNVTSNMAHGIWLGESQNNHISRNNIANNSDGIGLYESSNNIFHHNNFINNTNQVDLSSFSNNTWDNGCEGNYWSDYNGTDSDGDGIGDTPYAINENNTDHNPLMNPYWLPGDVNHDLKIDIYDVVRITGVYGSEQGDLNWNCHSDIAEPYGIINIYDVVTCTKDYRKEYTP
ncbi:right-handed parallel beta-helix repeat-containing protein [Candidatus Bathyarchaeota archaeon]|nr:right-handed parallel beta-helix repeat-containing protein [Candidatus Bathyarchaeota archaeon]